MDAILIRHCRLRVLRHGGWSWGAEPRQLLSNVTQRLPHWIMHALAHQLAGCPPDTTIPRVSVRVPIRIGELYSWPGAAPGETNADQGGGAVMQRIRARLSEALRAAVPALEDQERKQNARDSERAPDRSEPSPTPVTDVLCQWHAQGRLIAILEAVDVPALRAWIEAVFDEFAAAARTRSIPRATAAAAYAKLEELRASLEASSTDIARALALVIEQVVAPHGTADAPADQRDADPPPLEVERVTLARADAPPATAAYQTTHKPIRRGLAPPRQANRRPIPVVSVLPFVVTGVLARLGFFDGLRAALACAELSDQAECFAAAMTYKLAAAPHRGWHRDDATLKLAAAMAGQDEPPPNARLAQFLRGLSAVCSPLDPSLQAQRREVRTHDGILVDRFEHGVWAAMDVAGGHPLGWFEGQDDLRRLVDLSPRRSWWLTAGAAESDFLERLTRQGIRIVTALAPGRGQGWSATGALWTNDPALRRRGARLESTFDEAREILAAAYTEFIERRPLVIPSHTSQRPAAEYTIALAVCAALGKLAETLWRDREATYPLLALQRLGDLGGTVALEEGRVLVRPALGRRFMDLYQHGLLSDIAGVPWWPGRRVEFAGP